MPPRIPTTQDFETLSNALPVSLHFPDPPESTTAFLILFHGLGDHEEPFATFARNLNLPGVLAISVRGTAPVPAAILGNGDSGRHFHWGDDLTLDQSTGELDADPGFDAAARLVIDKLVKETLVAKCGWEMNDVIFFGFGQGGSLALGLATRLAAGQTVVDVTDGVRRGSDRFKGVVSLGGSLPQSMVSTRSARAKSATPVLLLQLPGDEADRVKGEFGNVTVVQWKRRDVAMPRDRDEVFPLMKFFADVLKSGW